MNFYTIRIIILLFLFMSETCVTAADFRNFILDDVGKSPEIRLENINKLFLTLTDSTEIAAAKTLLSDIQYEIVKKSIAEKFFMLAKERLQAADTSSDSRFSRYVALHDALSIYQATPIEWLTSEHRKEYLAWYENVVREIQEIAQNQILSSEESSAGRMKEKGLEDADGLINDAIHGALGEDISVAVPNGKLHKALKSCEDARDILMGMTPDKGVPRKRWESAMLHLSNSVTALKQRQRIKYALWAEGVYRKTVLPYIEKKLNDNQARRLYIFLSEVDVSLVSEPSLAREITKRLYELYDLIPTTKKKAELRYVTIISIDKRKTFDDF